MINRTRQTAATTSPVILIIFRHFNLSFTAERSIRLPSRGYKGSRLNTPIAVFALKKSRVKP